MPRSPDAHEHSDDLLVGRRPGRRKLPDDPAIPALQDILVVSSREPRIEHDRRVPAGWQIHDLRGQGTLQLQLFEVALDLADLDAGVLGAQGSAGR